jgi:hypothetical protein
MAARLRVCWSPRRHELRQEQHERFVFCPHVLGSCNRGNAPMRKHSLVHRIMLKRRASTLKGDIEVAIVVRGVDDRKVQLDAAGPLPSQAAQNKLLVPVDAFGTTMMLLAKGDQEPCRVLLIAGSEALRPSKCLKNCAC